MSYARDVLAAELCEATARTLEENASERQIAAINERDYLQPACLSAARNLWRTQKPMEVSTTLRVASERWPRLGAVDIAFHKPGEPPILVALVRGI